MIAQVGTISANNGKQIGGIIAEAMKKVGNGDVYARGRNPDHGNDTGSPWKTMQFDRGYLAYFILEAERMGIRLENALILINEKKIRP